MKIRKGDRVVVLQGKDRGKEGVVMRAMPKEGKVIVDGVNIARKHQKARKATMQGGIIDKDMPIEVSNVAIVVSNNEFAFDSRPATMTLPLYNLSRTPPFTGACDASIMVCSILRSGDHQ